MFVTRTLIAIGVAVAGCAARIGDGSGGGASVDANGGGSNGSGSNGGNTDAGTQVQPDAPSMNAACPNNRKVYLEFNGVTIARAATSDAVNNQASWIGASATIPPWHQGSGTRTADIATIVAGVKSRLAATPIEVVTARPAAGPYVMIVFGGQNTNNGGNVQTVYGGATNEHDCGDLVKSDVGWVSDGPSVSYAQDLAVGAIGWGLGLNGTNDPTDCMCAWANTCESVAGACTLSASIASTTSLSPATTCPGQNPQNEVAAFSTKFCQ
jgi:hypothetical protein